MADNSGLFRGSLGNTWKIDPYPIRETLGPPFRLSAGF